MSKKPLFEYVKPVPPNYVFGDPPAFTPTATPKAPSNRPEPKTFRITRIPPDCKREDIPMFFPGATIKATSLGYSPYSDSEKCATISFEGVPTSLESVSNEQEITVPLNGKEIDVDVDTNFLGFTTLNEVTEPIAMDVIAVAGLAGHAFGSWKECGGSNMWLRDMLPESIPNIRVLTYGFDSAFDSKSFSSIRDSAERFLELLFSSRSLVNEAQRPIVFICHDIGGLIVKEALSQASIYSAVSALHNDVFRSTYGAIMFGVPNRGLRIDELKYMVDGQPNERFINDLAQESYYLQELHAKFIHNFHLRDAEFVSCWETKGAPSVQKQDGTWKWCGLPVIMVTKASATYTIPHETRQNQHSIDSDHFSMIKITRHHAIYRTILRHLKLFVRRSPDVIGKRFLEKEELSRLQSALDRNDWDLQRSLNIAAWNGNHPALKLLLTRAEVNWKDDNGRSALYWSALNDKIATSKLLLDKGAYVSPNNNPVTSDRNDIVVKLHLLGNGVNWADPKNDEGTNALNGPASNVKAEAVKCLISKVLKTTQEGEGAVAKLLLESGVDKDARGKDGSTALIQAAVGGEEAVVRVLIEMVADKEVKDNYGKTALIVAAMMGSEAVVRALVETGADKEVKDNSGETALKWAIDCGHEAVARLLE